MQIFIRDYVGKDHIFDIEPTITISDVKAKIEILQNIPVKEQRLIFGSKFVYFFVTNNLI